MHEHLRSHHFPVVTEPKSQHYTGEKVLVVPMEEDPKLDAEGIPHEKAVFKHYLSEVHHMHSPEIEFDLDCNHGHSGIGAGLVGGLVGGAVAGGGWGNGWGGRGGYYGMPYNGYGFNSGVSVGDMYGAAETNKVGHQVARDIFASDRNQTQQNMMGDFALAQKVDGAVLGNTIGHAALAKDICDTKTTLMSEIQESRHLNAMEHCNTRETTLKETGAVLLALACEREQRLRDDLLIERARRDRAEDGIVQTTIINQIGSLNDAVAALVANATK